MESKYIIPKKEEFSNILLISGILGFLFAFSYMRYDARENEELLFIFIIFSIFIFLLITLRLIFMKIIAYRNAFEIDLRLTHFDRYGFNAWDTISDKIGAKNSDGIGRDLLRRATSNKTQSFKGIPVIYLSIFIYFITLGLLVFPCVWLYKIKKIPHLFLGSRKKFEYDMSYMYNVDISDYRYSKALFGGFVFYFIIGLILKTFVEGIFSASFYNWFTFILYWFAFWTIIPIFGTEGYILFRKSRIGWICAITVLILGMLSLAAFQSLLLVVFFTCFSVIFVYTVLFWKNII